LACSHTIAKLNNSNHAFSRTIPILTLVLEPVIVAGHDKRHFRGGNSLVELHVIYYVGIIVDKLESV